VTERGRGLYACLWEFETSSQGWDWNCIFQWKEETQGKVYKTLWNPIRETLKPMPEGMWKERIIKMMVRIWRTRKEDNKTEKGEWLKNNSLWTGGSRNLENHGGGNNGGTWNQPGGGRSAH